MCLSSTGRENALRNCCGGEGYPCLEPLYERSESRPVFPDDVQRVDPPYVYQAPNSTAKVSG